MNPILDTFLASFIMGITYTLWFLISIYFSVLIMSILVNRDDDDDDDDGGTLQPVYQGTDK